MPSARRLVAFHNNQYFSKAPDGPFCPGDLMFRARNPRPGCADRKKLWLHTSFIGGRLAGAGHFNKAYIGTSFGN